MRFSIYTTIFFVIAELVRMPLGFKLPNTFNQPTTKHLSVTAILNDGQGDFDPWNKIRWADWYDADGRILQPFSVDRSVAFMERQEPWELNFSDHFKGKFLFVIERQGVHVDGNGVALDARTPDQKLPLDELFKLKKNAWSNEGTCEIGGIFYDLTQIEDVPPSIISNFTFMGLKRGIKVNGTGVVEEHRLIVEDCVFERNRVGFYTNGYNTLLQNCELIENGYGGIYSGSGSGRNQFIGNLFRDNTLSQHQPSYGDFIGDTFFESEISQNHFTTSRIDTTFRRIGISMFRNMGEGRRLRKQMPHRNVIKENFFDGYSVAIHIGARMGRKTKNDVSHEGRDYAFYNTIENNTISNTEIGVKVNTEGNLLKSNIFDDVRKGIVLHCVFFELKNTTISDQDDTKIHLWYTKDDYLEYAEWFRFQDDLNEEIGGDEKIIEVYAEGHNLWNRESVEFRLNPPRLVTDDVLKSPKFGFPSVVCTGEFSMDLPGEEFVATWNKPVSRVEGKDYFDILVFDDKGTEINRTARSESEWKQIVTGYFTRDIDEGEMQIAAISEKAIHGTFPVFIFNRGYAEPDTILFSENIDPGIKIFSSTDHRLRVDFD